MNGVEKMLTTVVVMKKNLFQEIPADIRNSHYKGEIKDLSLVSGQKVFDPNSLPVGTLEIYSLCLSCGPMVQHYCRGTPIYTHPFACWQKFGKLLWTNKKA